MHYWDGPEVIEKEGVTLHAVCEPYKFYTDGRRSIPQTIKFATNLAPHLLREDFDIVDCQQFPYFPIFVAKLHELVWDTTFVMTWYEVWDDYRYDYLGWKGAFGQAVERATVVLPDTIIPLSSYIADDLTTIGRTNDIHVVENGVDYHGLRELPAAEADWDITYVGRFAEHKNVDWLLDAVATASDELDGEVETCIVSDGPERDDLERHAECVGVADHIHFWGSSRPVGAPSAT